MDMTMEQQLQALREEWVKYPERRKLIEIRAKLLKMKREPDTIDIALEVFGIIETSAL
jgi:hypothetical protein